MDNDKEKLNQILNHLNSGATILDVRSKWEFMLGHIPGSVNIPLSKVKKILPELGPSNKMIITVCASGVRSETAANLLKDAGCDAINGGSWATIRGLMEF